MNPDTVAQMDQAGAALRSIAESLGSMIVVLRGAGVSPDKAAEVAASIFDTCVLNQHYQYEDE